MLPNSKDCQAKDKNPVRKTRKRKPKITG